MKTTLPNQTASESAEAATATPYDTSRRDCSLTEVVVQLERLVAATLRQTAMMQDCSHQVSAAIILGTSERHTTSSAVEEAIYVSYGVARSIRSEANLRAHYNKPRTRP